jgi:hypothetical protein
MRIDRGLSIAIVVAGTAGCAVATEKGPEADALVDGKSDGATGIREHDHGLQDQEEIGVTLTREWRGHAFPFTLGTRERVAIHTALFSGDDGDEIDTVLYLFRRGRDGWGHYIRRNDDDPTRQGTMWSRIEEDLEPGEYRILAKAYDDEVGSFAVNLACADGVCNRHADVEPVEPTDLGTGTADAVSTRPVAVRLPLLGADDLMPLSRFNARLEAADLPTFPEHLEVSSTRDFRAAFQALATQSQREDVYAITGNELLMFASLEELLGGGLCVSGAGAALPGLVSRLGDSILSDMFTVYGWRAASRSAYEEWHEPTTASSIYEEWNAFDPSTGAVLLVVSDDDSGTERVVIVPRCR